MASGLSWDTNRQVQLSMKQERKHEREVANNRMHPNRRQAFRFLMCEVFRTLDSLPAPVAGGDR